MGPNLKNGLKITRAAKLGLVNVLGTCRAFRLLLDAFPRKIVLLTCGYHDI